MSHHAVLPGLGTVRIAHLGVAGYGRIPDLHNQS
jgi:hypothetical protein